MGLVTRIEEGIGRLVERPFRLRRGLDLVEVEVELRRRIARERMDVLGKVFIPNECVVTLQEAVYEEHAAFVEIMQRRMEESLAPWAAENGYSVAAPVKVVFVSGEGFRGMYRIDVRYGNETIPNPAHQISPVKNAPVADEVPGCTGDAGRPVSAEFIDLGTGEYFEIREGETVIGRDRACGIRLDDPSVSRRHAALMCRMGRIVLSDLNSTSGTRVNRERVARRILKDGDIISLGSAEVLFRTSTVV